MKMSRKVQYFTYNLTQQSTLYVIDICLNCRVQHKVDVFIAISWKDLNN